MLLLHYSINILSANIDINVKTAKFFSYLCTTIYNMKFMDKPIQPIFDKNTVEFVTVAAEYCGFLERINEVSRSSFVDKTLKLLPLLYLKASLLPACERTSYVDPETFVTETDYEVLRSTIGTLMAEADDYLEVFLEDMAYSDTPIKQNISENLADLYQVLKNFICVYQLGLDYTMNDALAICKEGFNDYWGQILVNVMRALHQVRYSPDFETEETDEYDDTYTENDLYEGLDMGYDNE